MEQKNFIIREYFPDIDDLSHDNIINAIHSNKNKITYSHKINGRWENQYLSIEFFPQIKKIFYFACKVGREIIDKPLVIPHKEMGLPINEFWFNISKPGESTGWHDHKNRSLLSGVYYLKVPDNAGNINFREKNGDQFHEWEIRSQTGKMILFHSNIEHSVSKNRSKDNRISIAFNLYALPIDIDSFSDSYSSNKFYF